MNEWMNEWTFLFLHPELLSLRFHIRRQSLIIRTSRSAGHMPAHLVYWGRERAWLRKSPEKLPLPLPSGYGQWAWDLLTNKTMNSGSNFVVEKVNLLLWFKRKKCPLHYQWLLVEMLSNSINFPSTTS